MLRDLLQAAVDVRHTVSRRAGLSEVELATLEELAIVERYLRGALAALESVDPAASESGEGRA